MGRYDICVYQKRSSKFEFSDNPKKYSMQYFDKRKDIKSLISEKGLLESPELFYKPDDENY